MKKENPFSTAFGREPKELIDRKEELSQIEDFFTRDYAPNPVYMITGVRGSGKTVALTKIYESFKKKDDWIVVDLNANTDLTQELVAQLYEIPSLQKLFIKAQLNLSAFGVGVEIKGVPPISHIGVALERMLDKLSEKNKRLLVCIDEAVNSENMRIFASQFQILLRHKKPVYLVMTGLYQNIDDLQNVETLTFLHRAQKIKLNSLNISSIAYSYSDIFQISMEKAMSLAKLTNGYAFAYQLLGYLCYENDTVNEAEIIPSFDRQLTELAYEKIWSELTGKEKDIIRSIAKCGNKVKDIREDLNMTSGTLSTYKMRLIKKGIVQDDTYGEICFTVPRFINIVQSTLMYIE